VKGKLAALVGGGVFPEAHQNSGSYGSGGPLHRKTHYCGSAVFLPESSLTREAAH
jgi:hypothetical protein